MARVVVTGKRRRGAPITDPFYSARVGGVANTYTKNIPLRDWETFTRFVHSRGWSKRYAIIRFVQELPRSVEMQKAVGGEK